ncbi:hypothetical protein QBC36DRAFT_322163 [Triangularia setosa]|uniref:Uncharacterized protein n=1 Tax=Triangularia setosa TaxID=2587417 RepID=A0AAN6WD15_9PEZI|nr:hypothetical protein QBC36DRAFT_322163 [Podospora setosa]
MAGLSVPSWCILLVISIYITPIAAWGSTNTNQFRDWYPQYGHIFEALKQKYCMTEYQNYLTGNKTAFERDVLGGGGKHTVLTQPVIKCILSHTSEYVKNGMTAAQVLLGVMPTVLSVMGASTEEMSMLANVARRPILALMLAAGSPSVYFSRAFEYHDSAQILQDHPNRLPQWRPKMWYSKLLISLAEYTVAAAAIANIATLNWDIGTKTVCAVWTDGIIGPTVWALLGLVVHVFGTIGLRLRICGWRGPGNQVLDAARRKEESVNAAGVRGTLHIRETLVLAGEWVAGIPRRALSLLRTEPMPSASAGFEVRIVTFQESKLFLVAAWAGSMATVFHIIFGTLIFASTTFIGIEDALSIVGRYIGSVSVCRIILMYELAGLRESFASVVPLSSGSNKLVVVSTLTPNLSRDSGDDQMVKQRVRTTAVSSQV